MCDRALLVGLLLACGGAVCSPVYAMNAEQCAAAEAINRRVGEAISKLGGDVYREMRANAGGLTRPCDAKKATLTAQQCGAVKGLDRRIGENMSKFSGDVYRELRSNVGKLLNGSGCA